MGQLLGFRHGKFYEINHISVHSDNLNVKYSYDQVWKFNCDYTRKSDQFCVIAKTDTLSCLPVPTPRGKNLSWKECKNKVKIKSSWK